MASSFFNTNRVPAGGFSFPPETPAPAAEGGGLSFGNAAKKNDGDDAANTKPAAAGGFSFGGAAPAPAAPGAFNFGGTPAAAPAPADSSAAAKAPAAPTFGFGGTSASSTASTDNKAPAAPSFGTTTAAPAASTTAPAPTFGFGSTPAADNDKTKAPTFTGFNAKPSDDSAKQAPASATTPAPAATTGFGFGQASGTNAAAAPGSAPAFNFGGGQASGTDTAKAPATAATTGGFSLGGSATDDKAPAPVTGGFSLGGAAAAPAPSTTTAPVPAGGFSFTSPDPSTKTPAATAETPATPAAGVTTPQTPAAGVNTPSTNTPAAAATPKPKEPTPLQYQTMSVEDILNSFQSQLEKDAIQYTKEAERVAHYDAILRDSQRNLVELGDLTCKLLVEQGELEGTIKQIGGFSTELDSNLTTLEKDVDMLFAAQARVAPQDSDVERESAYSTAINIDARLSTLSQQLQETLQKLDDSQDQVLSGPLGDVVRILNSHQNGLAQLEQSSRSMEQDIAQIERYLAQPR